MTVLTMTLLDGFEVRCNAGPPIGFATRKARALLAYLALAPGQTSSRERLAGLFWGTSSDEQARSNLRQTLSGLRKALPRECAACLVSEGDTVRLDDALVESDVTAFEALVAEGTPTALARAAALYKGGLLEGFSLREEAFEEWLAAERERLRTMALGALSRLLAHHQTQDGTDQAVPIAVRLLALDPLQEAVHRALMEFYGRQGRFGTAIKQYQFCRELLRRELGIEPEPATDRLYQELRARRRQTSPPADPPDVPVSAEPAGTPDGVADNAPDAALALPERPSIAVLPFTNMSGDAEQSYFSDGITEDIITELSRNRWLFVIARNSSFVYRDRAVGIEQVGRELGVAYVLEGSVRKAGSRVRVSAQLIDAASGDHLWAERYDRDLEDIFAVQDDLTRTIVATLVGRLDAHRWERAWRKPTENMAAYEYLLRGLACMHRYSRAEFAEGRQMFGKVVELDPAYARGHAWLAFAHVMDWFWEMSGPGLDQALAIGRHALALDDQEAQCHLALGITHLFRAEHDEAEHHMERAVALNPNDDIIAAEMGRLKMYLGQPKSGTEWVAKSMRLNPYHPNWVWNILGRTLHSADRFEDAIRAFKRISTPNFWNLADLAACSAEIGDMTAAKTYAAELRASRPDFTIGQFARMLPYKDPARRLRFLEGFRKAGLPV